MDPQQRREGAPVPRPPTGDSSAILSVFLAFIVIFAMVYTLSISAIAIGRLHLSLLYNISVIESIFYLFYELILCFLCNLSHLEACLDLLLKL